MLCEEYGFKNVDAGTGNIVQTSEKHDSSFTPPLARTRLRFGAGLYPAVFASAPQQHQHRIQCHCRRSLLPCRVEGHNVFRKLRVAVIFFLRFCMRVVGAKTEESIYDCSGGRNGREWVGLDESERAQRM